MQQMANISGCSDFIKNIADVMSRQEGDKLPVSAFVGREGVTSPWAPQNAKNAV